MTVRVFNEGEGGYVLRSAPMESVRSRLRLPFLVRVERRLAQLTERDDPRQANRRLVVRDSLRR